MDIRTDQSSCDQQRDTVTSPPLPENNDGGGSGFPGGSGGLIRPGSLMRLIPLPTLPDSSNSGGSGAPGGSGGLIRPGSMMDRARQAKIPLPETPLKCPRCDSTNTKFCYFNNYNLTQPRHFCKACRRYWTRGGALRMVPVGGGCRRIKRTKKNSGGGGGDSSSSGNSKSQDSATSNDQYHHRAVANDQLGPPSSSTSRIISQPESEVLSPVKPVDDHLSLSDLDMVKVIGQGSNGVVQLVQHKRTGQLFALKVIQLNIDEAIRKAIAEEMKITQSSQCPYLVTWYQSFYDSGAISLILEYMDRGSLADFLKSVKVIPEEYLPAIFKQVLQGLIYLHHDKNIIHHNLKPSNLLINHKGEVKITDFGVSTVMTNTADLVNTFAGTYDYLCPERIVGNKYGNKSDIWSLGLVVFECATGKFPYAPPGQDETWTSIFGLMEAIVDQPPPALPSENFSPELSSFISSCLQKDPDSRSSAKELMEHPFLNKYNDSGISLASYFTDAGSPLATFGNLSGTKIDIKADVTSKNHLENWGSFCEFLKNRQPPRLLSECTASDAIEFVRLFPSEKIEDVVSTLSTAKLRKIDGNFMENPFESPVVRTFLKGIKKEQTSEEMKGDETMLSFESNRNLNGMRSQLNSIVSLLNYSQSSAPHIVGLWGMAGIGKTTISKEIFRTQGERYDVCYFLPDFHIMCEARGLSHLRDEFVSKIFGEDNFFIDACDTKLSFTRDRFLDKKVLIFLDGVNNARDAEVLVGGFGWFSGGHTIILTSRNRQVLVQCNAKEIYEIQKLSEPESVQLCRQLTTEQFWKGRMSFITELVNYATGNPLALQVLSLAIQKQCINDEQHLSALRQHPPTKIQDAFKRSFIVLDDDEKNIFLDLACFFRGENKDPVVNILDGCGLFTDIGIQGLLDESLISLVDNKIEMPNIFQDTGQFVVRQESEEAGKRSRLWDSDDIVDMLINNSGTEAIEGIFLDGSGLTFELCSTVFEKMYRLRLLKFHYPASENDYKICLPQGLSSLPDALRLLHWERYPLGSLPRHFNPKNLVELNMPYSNLTKLWKGKKNLEKLKRSILSHSQQLTEFPRLSKARNLEHIDLEGCTSLVKVNSSILHHQKLTFLSLKGCTHLRIMPTTVHLESLEVLNLSGCSELEDLHDFSPNLIELYLAGTAIRELPSSLGDLTRLATLDLQNCDRLQHLPPGISKLKAVVILSTKHPAFSMYLSSVALPHKECRLKRVIESVIPSLRKRKREKSVFTAINQVLPERPGQPECHYYMKTGDCKYGLVCTFHHPKDRVTRVADIPSSMASETPDLHLPGISFPLGASSSSELVEASTKKLRIQKKPLGSLHSFGTSSFLSEITQETVGRDTTESNQGEEKPEIHKFAGEESLTSSWLA